MRRAASTVAILLLLTLPASGRAQASRGGPPPQSPVFAPAGRRFGHTLAPTWPDSVTSLHARRRTTHGSASSGGGAPLTRREHVYATVGMLVGAGAAFAACTAHRPPDLTREALNVVGAACALFGGLIGFTIGGLASSAGEPE